MADWIPLAEIASRTHVADRLVIAGHGEGQDHRVFRSRVTAWQTALAGRGARLALYFEDAGEFAAALFGAWHAGKTVYLPGDRLPETLARLHEEVDGFVGDLPADCRPASAPSEAEPSSWTLTPLDEARTGLVVFTSGSTGAPCAIDKRLAQLAREVEGLEAAFGAGLGDCQVHGTVSHQHIYGLLFRVLWPLAAGRAIVPSQWLYPEDLVRAVDAAPALLVSSPAHLKRLPESLDWSRAATNLRAVFSSGGPLPADAAERARTVLGRAPIEVYGSTETGGVAWRQRRGDDPPWRPLPGVEVAVAEGRLRLRSPHLPDADWWTSSDRAEAAAEGFRLLGRADRIVKIEERRVSLTALEADLAASPWLREARVLVLPGERTVLAAIGVPNAAGEEMLAGQGRRALAAALRKWLGTRQEGVARPRRWRFLEALPADAQGKASQVRLLALFRPELPEAKWLQREPGRAELRLDIVPELIAFDGHFPQAPILPGVAQLDWAIRYGREAFGLQGRFVGLEALKFQQVVRPGDRIVLSLEWDAVRCRLGFRYRSERGPHASGRVCFEAAGA